MLALSSRAHADDAAGEHGRKARVAYDLQDWPLAIQEFRAAYGAEQKPEYLFGLGQAQRQSGDFAAAIISFKAYKRSEGISAQQATAAELLITKCEAEQAKEEANAAARKNAQAAAPAPAPSPAPAAPAPVRPAAAAADERPSGPKPFYTDVLGDSLFVVGLGAAGAGAFLLLGGNSDMKSSSSKPTEGAAQAAADSAHSKQVMGSIALPIGGALLGAAVWRWISVGSSEHATTTGWLLGPSYVGYRGQF